MAPRERFADPTKVETYISLLQHFLSDGVRWESQIIAGRGKLRFKTLRKPRNRGKNRTEQVEEGAIFPLFRSSYILHK